MKWFDIIIYETGRIFNVSDLIKPIYRPIVSGSEFEEIIIYVLCSISRIILLTIFSYNVRWKSLSIFCKFLQHLNKQIRPNCIKETYLFLIVHTEIIQRRKCIDWKSRIYIAIVSALDTCRMPIKFYENTQYPNEILSF